VINLAWPNSARAKGLQVRREHAKARAGSTVFLKTQVPTDLGMSFKLLCVTNKSTVAKTLHAMVSAYVGAALDA
jgi:hypothetical protein